MSQTSLIVGRRVRFEDDDYHKWSGVVLHAEMAHTDGPVDDDGDEPDEVLETFLLVEVEGGRKPLLTIGCWQVTEIEPLVPLTRKE
ncbi:MAG: hypothetical protein ACRC7O_05965 [Fimbriiglobus sp.]